MAAFKISQTVEMNSSGRPDIKQAYGHLGDKLAHEWAVTVVRNSAPVDLTGYTAMAIVNNGAGSVEIVGTITGNVASALFPAACYAYEGTHECFMRITSGDATAETITATMYLNVSAGETDVTIDPGTNISTTLSGLLTTEAARVTAEEGRVTAEAAREGRLGALENADAVYVPQTYAAYAQPSGISWTLGYYWQYAAKTQAADASYCYAILTAAWGEVYRITAEATNNAYVCTLVATDDAYNVIDSVATDSLSNYSYTIPKGVTKLIVTTRRANAGSVEKLSSAGLSAFVDSTRVFADEALTWTAPGFWNRASTYIQLSTNDALYTCASMNVVAGDVVRFSIHCNGNAAYVSPMMAVGAGYKKLVTLELGQYADYEYTVPAGVSQLLFTRLVGYAYRIERKVPTNVGTALSGVMAGVGDASDRITCWGDSMTYGTGSTAGHSFPSVLATLTGKTVTKNGYPGDDSGEIAGYQGGLPLLVKPVTIPASGTVTIELTKYDGTQNIPFRFPSICHQANINPVRIAGVDGILNLTASENTTSNTFTFTRLFAGDAVEVVYPTPLITYASRANRRDIAVIWTGFNGGWNNSADTYIRQIKNMIAHQGSINRYIVIGITAGAASDYTTLNARCIEEFGRHYIDMRDYLINRGLADNGLTATAQDTTDLSTGTVPTSLRYDGTHFNDYGYLCVANQVYARMLELGYV